MKGKRDPDHTLAIVAGVRTPFCKAGTELKGASAADLATHAFRELLDRTGIDAASFDEVILGCGGPDAKEANIARVAALRAGVPEHVPAVTVQRNCASGMDSIFEAELRLRAGSGSMFLVGGTESMSRFPLIMGQSLTRMFERLAKARSIPARLAATMSFRPSMLKPRVALLEGLTDPVSGMLMGSTADLVARRFSISRESQDRFALASHERADRAQREDRFARETAPLSAPPKHKSWVAADNGIRKGQTLEALARLRPVFDKREGDVTVGNSCQVTDGAVALIVAAESRARALGLPILATIRGQGRAGLDPATMGLGPVHATAPALLDAGLGFDELELFEINEAFAAQVLGCLIAFASDKYCREKVGLPGALGEIDPKRLNVNGGAIALGHPIAASGARLVLTLAHELRSQGKRYGLATMCIGGGQGQAVVLEAA
jgi:acetyl-CoA C-acetyltransferase/acetyl-CoA acyltransferase